MRISIKGYITCKSAELYADCADNYAHNVKNNRFAICDGVSKSFFPKIWAKILADGYVSGLGGENFDDLLTICQHDWYKRILGIVSGPDVKYYTLNAFNNRSPAFSTFVGLEFRKKGNTFMWNAFCLGDSFLFFIPKEMTDFDTECISLSSGPIPYVFDNFPDYLSSVGNDHNGYPPKTISHEMRAGDFYLMTDALAEWFLHEKEQAITIISSCSNQQEFERFVQQARKDNKLSNDDTSFLMISVEDDHSNNLNYSTIAITDLEHLVNLEQIEKKKQEIPISDTKEESIPNDAPRPLPDEDIFIQ